MPLSDHLNDIKKRLEIKDISDYGILCIPRGSTKSLDKSKKSKQQNKKKKN